MWYVENSNLYTFNLDAVRDKNVKYLNRPLAKINTGDVLMNINIDDLKQKLAPISFASTKKSTYAASSIRPLAKINTGHVLMDINTDDLKQKLPPISFAPTKKSTYAARSIDGLWGVSTDLLNFLKLIA